MARIRSIKPEYWADEDLAVAVSRDARLLYIGLWNLADEHGRLRADPRYIKGQLFAYDDDLTPKAIDRLMGELAAVGKVQRYRSGTGAYAFLPRLAAHQRLEPNRVDSKLPAPPDPNEHAPSGPSESAPMVTIGPNDNASDSDPPALLYGSGSMEQGTGSMGAALQSARTKRSTRGRRIPDDFAVTPEMVAWAREKAPHVDGRVETEKFVNYWQAKTGKDATKLDWVLTWRNWMLSARDRYGPANGRASPNGQQREHNGLMLNERTIADLERRERLAAIDAAQQAASNGQPAIGAT